MKEKNETLEYKLNEMEASYLTEIEFKIMVRSCLVRITRTCWES